MQGQHTASLRTVQPAAAPQHLTVDSCCIPHAAAHGAFKDMSAPFLNQSIHSTRQMHECHLNRVESIWPSDTKAASSFERPLGTGPKHAEVKQKLH